MCQFMSGIITQKETLFDLDNDSHEFLVEKYKLDDKTKEPDFVRVELVPKDGNVFNHKKSNWELKVDQDFQPEWFSKKFAEKEMRIALVQRIDQRFVIGRKIKEISIGVWWIGKGGSVNKVYSGGSVNKVCSGGSVNEVCFGGSVNEVCGSVNKVCFGGSVNKVCSGGSVNEVCFGGSVNKVCSGGSVNEVCFGGSVNEVCFGGSVNEVCSGGSVNEVWGSVNKVYSGGSVNKVWGSVNNVWGSVNEVCSGGSVNNVWGSVKIYSPEAKYKKIEKDGIVILYYKYTPEIVVANKDIKLTLAEVVK